MKAIGLTCAVLGIVLFTSLGVWQLYRLEWKLNLIKQVESQLAAEPVPAPSDDQWGALAPYQKVYAQGRWIKNKDTLVLAVTAYGRGYWVLSPLQTDKGFVILINRGFVPADKIALPDIKNLEEGSVKINGLLRLSEQPYAFLRHNDPGHDRWYARNVEGIAAKHNLKNTAPYFIDAEDAKASNTYPIGGLTVVKFRNTHLVYALTWFSMAIGLAGALMYNFKRDKSNAGQ